MEVYLHAEHEDNRVFHFSGRGERAGLICLCLGGLQWEAALCQDPKAPAIRWRAEPRQKGLEGVRKFLRDCVESPEWRSELRRLRQVQVAVSWPGFLQGTQDDPSPEDKWFSTALGGCLQRSDVAKGIQVEIRAQLLPCEVCLLYTSPSPRD